MRPKSPTRWYYWLVTADQTTKKPYLLFGSAVSESDARQRGIELLGNGDFEIRRFNTRDIGAASAQLRGKRLEQSHSLQDATKRIGHEKSLKRDKPNTKADTPVSSGFDGGIFS